MSLKLASPGVNLPAFSSELESWFKNAVPAAVCVSVARIDPFLKLHPEEEKYVLNAVAARRAEFATGRYCARELLSKLGYVDTAIPVGPKREPLWPDNISGSISHDQGIAVAAISAEKHVSGLGVDLLGLESSVDDAASGLIADESEISSVGKMLHSASRCELQYVNPLLLVFSAKESAIKAVSPSLEHYLDFREIQIEPGASVLRARFLNFDIALDVYWRILEEMIVTLTLALKNQGPAQRNCDP
ncbi:MAG: 4'-phosphopantetheinyl transferase superfamily protein [Gammaproteobacteria bacterium]|nr:4'-phosphopantetheinyl transferase superfamily protein [Gammaproteobacteria bacterium]